MKISRISFSGMFPRINERLLEPVNAAIAVNCDLAHGVLQPCATVAAPAATTIEITDGTGELARPDPPSVELVPFIDLAAIPFTLTCRPWNQYIDNPIDCTLRSANMTDEGISLRFWLGQQEAGMIDGLPYYRDPPIYTLGYDIGGATGSKEIGSVDAATFTPLTYTINGAAYQFGDFAISDFLSSDKWLIVAPGTETYPDGYQTLAAHEIQILLRVRWVNTGTDPLVYVAVRNSGDDHSQPSLPSEIVTRQPGYFVQLTNSESCDVYRNDGSSMAYPLLVEAVTTYDDAVPAGLSSLTNLNQEDFDEDSFGAKPTDIPDDFLSTEWRAAYHAGGFWVSFVYDDESDESTVWFSEPAEPTRWPPKYCFVLKCEIKGVAYEGGNVYLLTDGNPYVLSGSHPKHMYPYEIPNEQACLNTATIFTNPNMVGYVASDGIVGLSGRSSITLSEAFFSRDTDATDYRANPADPSDDMLCGRSFASIGTVSRCFIQQGKLYAVVTGGAWRWDIRDNALSNLVFMETATSGTLRWRSKTFVANKPLSMSAARVGTYNPSESSPKTTLRTICNGEVVDDTSITNDEAFNLTTSYPDKEWAFEVESTDAVHSVELATSKRSIRSLASG